jgi:hypothetical protein
MDRDGCSSLDAFIEQTSSTVEGEAMFRRQSAAE